MNGEQENEQTENINENQQKDQEVNWEQEAEGDIDSDHDSEPRDPRPDEERRYPERSRIPKKLADGMILWKVTETEITDDEEPKTVNEALAGYDKEKWKAVMKEEFNSLVENYAWTLVE
jgi:hypothetical protein